MELPLGRHEEKVLHNWLQGEGQERGAKAQLLPLYYIQRGRAPEALLYSERHGAGKQTNDDTARAFGCVLTAANEMMPLAQRQLCAGRAKQQQTEQVTLRCSEPRCEHMGTELDGVALLESTGRVLVEPVAEEQEGHGDVAGCRVPEDSMELDLSPMAAPMGPRMPPPSR